jgi:hypothetical protein
MPDLLPTLTELQNLAAWLVLVGAVALTYGILWGLAGWLVRLAAWALHRHIR